MTKSIRIVSTDGDKAADINRVNGDGAPYYETTKYARESKSSTDYSIKAHGTLSGAVADARGWAGRNKNRKKSFGMEM